MVINFAVCIQPKPKRVGMRWQITGCWRDADCYIWRENNGRGPLRSGDVNVLNLYAESSLSGCFIVFGNKLQPSDHPCYLAKGQNLNMLSAFFLMVFLLRTLKYLNWKEDVLSKKKFLCLITGRKKNISPPKPRRACHMLLILVTLSAMPKNKIYNGISPSPSLSEIMFMFVVNEAGWGLNNLLDLKTRGPPLLSPTRRKKKDNAVKTNIASDLPVAISEVD